MFGLVINPRLATRPFSPKKPDTAASGPGLAVSCNPTLPSQGLVWRGIFVTPHEMAGLEFRYRSSTSQNPLVLIQTMGFEAAMALR
jgi:hypothetical protein